ncbi:MAG: YigZ family protein [Acidobacteriota bacterium]
MNKSGSFFSVKTIEGPYEIKEKGSRFISFIFPVSGKESAEERLGEIRKKYFDSTHVCFGYRIGDGEEKTLKYSDDGEPSGTAGLPILNEIRGKELFNTLIIVIRYYGGTKLGTGGLARAYRDSAKLAVKNSKIIEKIVTKKKRINLPFELEGDLMKLINRFKLKLIEKNYTANGVEVDLDIPVSIYDTFGDTLVNFTKGKINF